MDENIIRTEIKVHEGSPLCGMTVEEVQKKFGVKVHSISNPFPSAHEKKPDSKFKIYPMLYIKLEGKYAAVKDLCLHSVEY
jgi:Trk K+ transport system NAD-binding subunit